MNVLLVFLFFITFASNAEVNLGHVVGVSDGDTIKVLSLDKKSTTIRLDAIDAPEKNQDFGQASKKHLSHLIFKKQVTYEPLKIDRYGRTVAAV